MLKLFVMTSQRYDSFLYSRQPICLKKTGSASESIAMRTPFFTVTSLAVHVTIRTVASNYRIQSLVAILTFETFPVPFLQKRDNVILRKIAKTIFSTNYKCEYIAKFGRPLCWGKNEEILLYIHHVMSTIKNL